MGREVAFCCAYSVAEWYALAGEQRRKPSGMWVAVCKFRFLFLVGLVFLYLFRIFVDHHWVKGEEFGCSASLPYSSVCRPSIDL